MAWIERNRANGPFQLVVRYGEQRLKRSTRTCDEREANEIASRVDRRLRMLETGEVELPDGIDVLTFLMSEGQRTQGTSKPIPSVSLEQVCDKFLSSLPEGALEANTLLTMRIHLNHIQRILGASARLRDINRQMLQEFVNARSKQSGRKGKKVGTVTIKKELTSFGVVWKYAFAANYVSMQFPNQDLRFPKTAEKPRFQTWKEIELQIASEGLTEAEQAELWETLFLTLPEVDELLAFIKEQAGAEFLYPMVVAAAHTGARRSELVRSQRSDFNFRSGMVTWREKKRVRGGCSTRTVPMSPLLREVMLEWFAKHPGGRSSFCLRSSETNASKQSEGILPLTVHQAHGFLKRSLKGKWSHVRGWHVLRHSFASNCAAQCVDQRTINVWMGHQTEEMVRRYRHLIPDQQLQAIKTVFGSPPNRQSSTQEGEAARQGV